MSVQVDQLFDIQGICVGPKDAVKIIENKRDGKKVSNDELERAINRIKYEANKDIGCPPKFHKGIHGRRYDNYTCGNCGRTLTYDILQNYCWGCGYKILWDSCRCLTK